MKFKIFVAPKKVELEKQVNDFLKKHKHIHIHEISTTATKVCARKLTFATNVVYDFSK